MNNRVVVLVSLFTLILLISPTSQAGDDCDADVDVSRKWADNGKGYVTFNVSVDDCGDEYNARCEVDFDWEADVQLAADVHGNSDTQTVSGHTFNMVIDGDSMKRVTEDILVPCCKGITYVEDVYATKIRCSK